MASVYKNAVEVRFPDEVFSCTYCLQPNQFCSLACGFIQLVLKVRFLASDYIFFLECLQLYMVAGQCWREISLRNNHWNSINTGYSLCHHPELSTLLPGPQEAASTGV